MITRSSGWLAAGSASVIACLIALSSVVYAADTHTETQVQVNIAGNLGSFEGTTARKATVFVYEGLDLDKLVAKVQTDAEGNFSFAAKPLVSFFDEGTGQLKSQAFVSYQVMAFWHDDAGHPQILHRFQSVRFQPGDVSKAETWSLQLKQMPVGFVPPEAFPAPPEVLPALPEVVPAPPEIVPAPPEGLPAIPEAIPAPQGRVVPFDRLQPRVHRVGVGGANPYGRVVPVHWPWEQGFCPLPCIYKIQNLGDYLTKVGEVHTTAGAATTFKFGISSAVTIDMAVSYDNFATFSLATGNTWSKGLSGTWRRAESDTQGIEALTTFHYERWWFHYDGCLPVPYFPFVKCGSWSWQVVLPVKYNGGAYDGAPVGGDNIQPESIPVQWLKAWTSPGNSWGEETGHSWYIEGSVGLNLEIVKVKLGARLEKSVDTKYEADFDPAKVYDYTDMISYDRGTNGAVWYFTHRLQKEALTATGQTSNSVKLQWTPFTGLDFAKYEVWYKKLTSNVWSLHSAITNKATTSGEFGRLASGTTYQFYLKVKENSGVYSNTNTVNRTTDSGGPPPRDPCPGCPPPEPISPPQPRSPM